MLPQVILQCMLRHNRDQRPEKYVSELIYRCVLQVHHVYCCRTAALDLLQLLLVCQGAGSRIKHRHVGALFW